jgi:hypothetical protein
MNWLRVVSMIIFALIVISIIVFSILACVHSSNKGSVQGTGFIIQELNGAGGVRYDVDDDGNIYFAVTSVIGNGILVYNEKGDYMYTLPIRTVGGLMVKIDEDNNILVYDVRQELVKQYNSLGIRTDTIQDEDHSLEDTFPSLGNQNVRERNGIRFINNSGTITKVENGVETVVFTVPAWQRWFRASKVTLILSCVAMFLRLAIPLWIKAYKQYYT